MPRRRRFAQRLSLSLLAILVMLDPAKAIYDSQANATTTTPPSSTQKTKPDQKTITGRIVDEQNQPIADAQLWWAVARGKPEVIIHAVSDAEGRFSISAPDTAPARPSWVNDTLWVLKSGYQLTTASTRDFTTPKPEKSELVIQLQPETDTSFIVLAPDQKPISGALVEPWHFKTHIGYDVIPPQALELISQATDSEGQVHLPSMDRTRLSDVRVTSEEFGTQEIRVDDKKPRPAERKIQLRSVGRVEGRLIADNGQSAPGVEFYFRTEVLLPGSDWKTEGFAKATTDDDGRFVIPAIAEGYLRIDHVSQIDAPAIPRLPNSMTVEPGKTLELEIKLEPTVPVRGLIKTEDTDTPIPGAEILVRFGVGRQGQFVNSDDEGRFEARVLPGPVYTQASALPQDFHTYTQTGDPSRKPVDVPTESTVFDLPPIELTPTVPQEGTIVDQHQKPVPNAMVFGIEGNRRYGFARANEQGEFISRIPTSIDIKKYEVSLDGETRLTPTIESTDPLILRVTIPADQP